MPRPSLRLTGVFVGVVVVGLLIGWLLRSEEGAEVATVGMKAPDFTVSLIDGGEFTLSEELAANNRTVVLNLWASWCIPCRTETPEISDFARENPGVTVIGVAVEDTEDGSRAFAAEFAPSYSLAIGDEDFDDKYPRLGLPATYIIDADGVIGELFNGIVTVETLEDLVFG